MANIVFKVKKEYGTLAKFNDYSRKVNLVEWNNSGNDVIDIRFWNKDVPSKGITLSKDEAIALKNTLEKMYNVKKDTDIKISKEEPTDPHKKKRGRPRKKETENKDIIVEKPVVKTTEKPIEKSAKTTSAKILQFPKKKPEIEKMITEGNATYEQCLEKISKEREVFKENDSQYVIDGLLELCKVDQDFRNNFMLDCKSYTNAFDYFCNMAKQGYAIKYGNMSYLDNDMALAMAIDYYNTKEN